MEYKKSIIILILTIFLFSIASVCASDANDTAIASEDTTAIELSQNEEITTTDETQKTIQTNDTEMLTANDEETTATQNNLDTLSLEEKTYTNLSNAVGTGGDINLQPAYYKYNGESNTITITNPGIINGNGAIIDMAGSTIRAFIVDTEGVTIKNLTIKNANYNGDGGAIFFSHSGSVTNCNFNDNKATGSTSYGGAVYFKSTGTVSNCNFTGNTAANGGAVWMNSGTVSNCNFINNSATGEDSLGGAIVMYSGSVSNCNFTNNHASYAGAVYFYQGTGSVTNCNFTNNTATYQGGAIRFSDTGNVTNCNFTGNTASGDGGAIWMYSGSVENCNFTNNTATYQGGAIFSWNWYTAADTCIFKRNSGENVNVVIYPPTLNVDNFTTFYGSGEKLTFNLTTDSGVPVNNGNISISVYFKDNNSWVRNYSCLSGEGWSVDLSVGSYYAIYNTEYAEFKAINRTITITPPNYTFWALNHTINDNDASEINLTNDYYYDPAYDEAFANGIVINRKVIINGNSHTIDAKGKARVFNVQADDVTIENLTIKNANYNGDGGAVYFAKSGRAINCNFTGNNATKNGGAIWLSSGSVTNCNFTGNNATKNGGAVYFASNGNVTNCNFVNNSATSGGAIDFEGVGKVINCNFTDNFATKNGGAIWLSSGSVTNCNFTGNTATGTNSKGGAVYFNSNGEVTNCNFTGNTLTGTDSKGGAVYFWNRGSVENCNFTNNSAVYGGAIRMTSGSVENCNFTDNHATVDVGAVYFLEYGNVGNCNFTNNSASSRGGAVYFYQGTGSVTNCNFTANHAANGSAIYFYGTSATKTVSNSRFLNNRANAETLEVIKNDNNITITFTGQNNLLNAIYSRDNAEVTFNNVTYWGKNGITTISTTKSGFNKEEGQNITVGVVVNDKLVLSEVMVTDENGQIVLDIITGNNYYIGVRHDTDSYYTEAERTISNNTKFNVNVTSQTTHNRTVNITAKSNIPNEIIKGKLLFILPNGDEINATYADGGIWWAEHTFDGVGDYNVGASYIGLDDVIINNATISIRYDARVEVKNKTLNLLVGDDIVIVVTTVPVGVNISYVPDDSGVYSLKDGIVTALREGTGNILIKVGGGGVYVENSTEIAITVSKVPTAISIENPTLKLEIGDEVATGATLTPADAGNLTYTVSNSSVVKVNDGKITALAEGEATITVSFADDKKYADAENKTIAVNVTLKDVSVSLNNSTLNLFVGDNFTVVATTNPLGLNVSFVTDDSGVYSVDENGTVTALRNGTGNILVKVGGDGVYAANSTEIPVTVSKVPTEIKIASPTGEMSVGAMGHVAAELIPSDAGNLTYASNDTSVVNVSSTGVIKANNAGIALITVSFAGNDNYDAAENKTIAITVSLKPVSISLNNATLDLKVDDNFTIVAVTDPAGLNVSFVQDDSGVYSVDENGTVTALKVGTGNILVKVGDGKIYAENSTEIAVTVSKIATKITLTNETIELKPHKSIGDLATLSPAEAGNLTYASSDEDTVLVSEDGIIYARIKGTATVTVSFAGNDKYKAAENRTITVNVTLNDASVSVENDTIDLNVDDTFIINATANPSFLTVYYSSSNESVAVVTDYGNVKAVGEGTAIITLTVGNGETYAINSTNVTVTVSKIPTEITIDTASLDLFVGDETVIAANLTPADAGNLTFTSSNDTVVIVDDQGNVIANEKGKAIITVSFAGDDKYAAVNKTIAVDVKLNPASVTVDNDTLDLKLDETYKINATKHPDTIMLDITYTSSDSSVASVDEKGIVTAVSEGTAVITLEVGDGEIYAKNSTNVTVTVSKVPTEIVSSALTIVYNSGGNLIVTLNDAYGNPISDANVTVDLNGAKTYTTDKNGQVKVSTKGLVPKTYTANITFSGSDKYKQSTKDVKVTVKKATPKITAKAKTFKTTTKNKKYTITLKDNNGKPIKKATVYLKVGGKTYKAVTNSKGKATFNLKKLTKKGKFNAVITYKGSNCYNKLTKKAKITVKTAFKTVARGSKDSATVKKIQRALKNNGYYLSYNGHYLMVDGIFETYTEMAVKDFQRDHGLKVTGKVDEKTAKKLKIIK